MTSGRGVVREAESGHRSRFWMGNKFQEWSLQIKNQIMGLIMSLADDVGGCRHAGYLPAGPIKPEFPPTGLAGNSRLIIESVAKL
ncbi:hypothetical protein NDU88_003608 [Pleurodeles waltl]|uniref:Uncharacterized protein n=1 Tax=Pleurodeles waltl TaxID=8319 RepID=A0AAV7PA41_PLEWA|nr:hypothetical protein NDU88_003608 [Pleurodeles waltl]